MFWLIAAWPNVKKSPSSKKKDIYKYHLGKTLVFSKPLSKQKKPIKSGMHFKSFEIRKRSISICKALFLYMSDRYPDTKSIIFKIYSIRVVWNERVFLFPFRGSISCINHMDRPDEYYGTPCDTFIQLQVNIYCCLGFQIWIHFTFWPETQRWNSKRKSRRGKLRLILDNLDKFVCHSYVRISRNYPGLFEIFLHTGVVFNDFNSM